VDGAASRSDWRHTGKGGRQATLGSGRQRADAIPSVLANMSRNLAWTSELGEASVNQRQDLTNAIQALRQRARQAGNLSTTTQETVSTKGQTSIIQPAATDVVYLPQYDPWLVYGASMAVFPGWYPYPGLFLDGPGVAFGLDLRTPGRTRGHDPRRVSNNPRSASRRYRESATGATLFILRQLASRRARHSSPPMIGNWRWRRRLEWRSSTSSAAFSA
jgi:Protein of unknown function (DUF3300)